MVSFVMKCRIYCGVAKRELASCVVRRAPCDWCEWQVRRPCGAGRRGLRGRRRRPERACRCRRRRRCPGLSCPPAPARPWRRPGASRSSTPTTSKVPPRKRPSPPTPAPLYLRFSESALRPGFSCLAYTTHFRIHFFPSLWQHSIFAFRTTVFDVFVISSCLKNQCLDDGE